MKRQGIILGFIILLASVVGAFAAPPEQPWESTTYTLWADTLPGRFTADSALYLGPVNVFGARQIIVDTQTTGGLYSTDTLSIGEMIFDTCGNGTYITYPAGGVVKAMLGIEVSTGGVINPEGTQIYRMYSAGMSGIGGTPIPITTRNVKFKVKSGNQRKFAGALNTNLQSVGTITVRMHVIR